MYEGYLFFLHEFKEIICFCRFTNDILPQCKITATMLRRKVWRNAEHKRYTCMCLDTSASQARVWRQRDERMQYERYPSNWMWKPIELWDVEAPIFLDIRLTVVAICQPYVPVGSPLPPGRFLVLISVRGWVAIVRLEMLGHLINAMTSSGM
jgi:hypothetical protein